MITQGEHAGREVRITGAGGLVADTAVWLGVTVDPLSGDVFAQGARTAENTPKTTRKPQAMTYARVYTQGRRPTTQRPLLYAENPRKPWKPSGSTP